MLEWQAGGPAWASSAWITDSEWCLFVSARPVFRLHPAESETVSVRVGQNWFQLLRMEVYF